MKIVELQERLRKLSALAEDPQPGLSTWNAMLGKGMQELTSGWNEGATPASAVKTPQEEQEEWRRQLREPATSPFDPPCSLMKPIMMVIPNEGVIIPCQKHSLGHFIRPSAIIQCNAFGQMAQFTAPAGQASMVAPMKPDWHTSTGYINRPDPSENGFTVIPYPDKEHSR